MELEIWTGGLNELCRVVTSTLAEVGTKRSSPLSSRVARDYQRRGILSAPVRDGVDARRNIYAYRHILELCCARTLLEDGWSLAKLAENIRLLPNGKLAEIAGVSSSGKIAVSRTDSGFASMTTSFVTHVPFEDFSQTVRRNSETARTAKSARERLGISDQEQGPQMLVQFEIAPFARLFVSELMLRDLRLEEIRDLSAIVEGALQAYIGRRDSR